jgi:hypothetical protein
MAKSKNHSQNHKYKWKNDIIVLKDVCFECGSNKDIHYHHVVPETKGGNKTLPLCIICHGKVHNRDFLRIKELQRIGIAKAKAKGVYVGRAPSSKETPEKFLAKPKNKKIAEYLSSGYKMAEIVSILKCSYSTVNKVKKVLNSN